MSFTVQVEVNVFLDGKDIVVCRNFLLRSHLIKSKQDILIKMILCHLNRMVRGVGDDRFTGIETILFLLSKLGAINLPFNKFQFIFKNFKKHCRIPTDLSRWKLIFSH